MPKLRNYIFDTQVAKKNSFLVGKNMLNFFPPKQRSVPPRTNVAAINHDITGHSSRINQEPDQSQQKISYISTPTNNYSHNESKPIIQTTSITLKTQDRGKYLVEGFAELYKELDSADVIITCGRNHEILKAHRFVLSFGSEYFRDALKIAPCKHPIVVVKNIPGEIMSRILEYMYMGKVTFKSESELKQFFNSAKYLQVFGIRDEQYSVED